MNPLKFGQEIIFDGITKGIMHAECSYIPLHEIEDKGKLEEVISRNQEWLNVFNHLIKH